jgi:hypothetical protein
MQSMSAAPWSSITINVLSLQHRHHDHIVAIWLFGLFLMSCVLLSWEVYQINVVLQPPPYHH